jgi:hypothetical protein
VISVGLKILKATSSSILRRCFEARVNVGDS